MFLSQRAVQHSSQKLRDGSRGSRGKGVLLMRLRFQVVELGLQGKRVSDRVLRDERPNSRCGRLDVKESSSIPGGLL